MMKKQLERFNEQLRLPISSIGNMCLLPDYYNRKKGEKTIYQYKDETLSIEEIEKKFSFTEKEDLEWINDNNIEMKELKTKYINFINKRFEKIENKLLNILYR